MCRHYYIESMYGIKNPFLNTLIKHTQQQIVVVMVTLEQTSIQGNVNSITGEIKIVGTILG